MGRISTSTALILRLAPLEQECNSQKQKWIADRGALQNDVDTLQAHIGMIAQLVAKDQELTKAIDGNLRSIEQLGFKHRAEDFEEWDKLSDDAKKEFEAKVKEQVIDLLSDKVQERNPGRNERHFSGESREMDRFLGKR